MEMYASTYYAPSTVIGDEVQRDTAPALKEPSLWGSETGNPAVPVQGDSACCAEDIQSLKEGRAHQPHSGFSIFWKLCLPNLLLKLLCHQLRFCN